MANPVQDTSLEPNQKSAPQSALAQWRGMYQAELKAVDGVILDVTNEHAALIPQITQHIIAGGKRIRPVLLILSAKLCGYESGERHINLAACVELLHTATLLHDDVVDESKLRRGVDTANEVWGNQASVLVGDFLLSRSFQLMARDGSLHVLQLLSDVSAVITEGEVKQLMAANDVATSRETYIDIIASKTSALFAAATRIGAVVAEKNHSVELSMEAFGRNLGIAFQIADDALDYMADEEALGKTVGDDFREGKVTLPVILAYSRGDVEQQAFWARVIGESQQAGDLEAAIGYFKQHEALKDTLEIARQYADDAIANLGEFPDSPAKQALVDLAEFSVNRAY